MGILNVFDLIVDVATLPLNIAKDIVTMGGVLVDEESSSLKKLSKISDDIEEI